MLRRQHKKLRGFRNSILPPHIPSRVISYIEQLLAGSAKNPETGEVDPRAVLTSYRVLYHTRGFDIVGIKIQLVKKNRTVLNVINKVLEQSAPGSRHHFDDNPTLYTFLALVHNKLGRIVRSKLGLDYAAFDRGNQTIAISITEPAVETPPPEDPDKLEAEIAPAAEASPEANLGAPDLGATPGGAPPMGGPGPDLGGPAMGPGPMPGMGDIEPETATPIGGVPNEQGGENPADNEQEENIDDDIANIAKNMEF